MTSLTDRTPKDTYKDLVQVSNSNAGIDGTRRNISDGEGTNAPIKVSTSAAEFTGIVDLSAATLGIAADAILFSNIDWSGTDTLTGEIDVASGASIDFLSGSTLTLATGSTFTLPDNFIPLAKVDLSGDDTIGGALTFTSASTFTSGASLEIATGASLVIGGSLDLASASTTFAANSVSLGTVAQIASASTLGRASGAGTGDVTALTASQAAEILKFSGLLPTARAYITNSGTAAIAEDVGVTSLNQTGTGIIEVTLDDTMSSNRYSIIPQSVTVDGFFNITAQSTTGFTIRTDNAAGAATDYDFMFVVVGTKA